MIRLWLAVAGLGGAASVIAGALAAHLADDPKSAELLRTGAVYGVVHAVALIAVIALAQGREPRRGAAAVAGWSFTSGIMLFSFSLFALAADAERRQTMGRAARLLAERDFDEQRVASQTVALYRAALAERDAPR